MTLFEKARQLHIGGPVFRDGIVVRETAVDNPPKLMDLVNAELQRLNERLVELERLRTLLQANADAEEIMQLLAKTDAS